MWESSIFQVAHFAHPDFQGFFIILDNNLKIAYRKSAIEL